MSVVAAADAGCAPGSSWVCDKVFDLTDSSAWARASEWIVSKPLRLAFYAAIAFVVARVVRWMITRSLRRVLLPSDGGVTAKIGLGPVLYTTESQQERAQARVETLSAVFGSIASVFVWFVAIAAMLDVFNVSLGPLLAGAGVAGVALGFGAQNVVRDTLAGTFMILDDQLGVGDTVDLGEAVGTVERVTLRATRLRDVNGTVWYVPNGQVRRVGNKSQDWAQAVLDVEVGIDSNIDEVQSVLHTVAHDFAADSQWSGVVLDPPSVWGVEAFTPFTYTVRLVVKTRPGVQWGVMRELRARILAALADADIHFH